MTFLYDMCMKDLILYIIDIPIDYHKKQKKLS